MNLYTHTMATNLAVTSVYSKANNVLEPKQSGRLRRDKKHKDGVEVSISRGSPSQNHEELLNILKGRYGSIVGSFVQPPIFVHSFLVSLIRFLGREVSCLGHGEV